MNLTARSTYLLYWVFALAFLGLQLIGHYPAGAALKATPALLFAAFYWQNPRLPLARVLAVGFLCSAAGDVFLHLDRQALFVQGLASFLVAHLCYVLFFVRNRRRVSFARGLLALIPIAVSGILTGILYPRLGALTVPVILYIGAITAMGVSSVFVGPWPPLAYLGALVFTLSDSLIAWGKFVDPLPGALPVILVTYFLGNFGIGWGAQRANAA
ncbi:MAG: lysoplasmalogenase [Bdellovibrionales bacterium]|nr:lysoplasmalogenase [Bdellovibrionales bacterium]